MLAKATMTEALEAILEERLYQDGKYGSPEERYPSIGDYLVILRGELEEAEQAFRKGVGPGECLWKCCRWVRWLRPASSSMGLCIDM